MSEFKREGRYIVVKPDCEDSLRTERLRNYIDEMCFHTPDCVVIEADWPEYEPVWRMIERRVTGDSSNEWPVEVLGYSVVGNRYAIRLTKGEVLELSENYADHLIELVDRKHLTDAQFELAALREELARIKGISDNYYSLLVDANQSLAAAEQLIAAQPRKISDSYIPASTTGMESGVTYLNSRGCVALASVSGGYLFVNDHRVPSPYLVPPGATVRACRQPLEYWTNFYAVMSWPSVGAPPSHENWIEKR